MVAKKEIEKLENSNVKLTVTIGKSDVESVYKKTLDLYIKNAQIPGFRRGKVPASVLETKFGDAVKNDAMADLIEESLKEIFDTIEEKPLGYSQPEMEKMDDFDLSKDFSFTITYDVFPSVKVENLTGVTIEQPQVEITDDDIKKELEEIQERNSIVLDKSDDAKAEKGDIGTFTFCELDGNQEEVAGTKRQDFVFTIGDGLNLYKFDDEVTGMKKGETKVFTKEYPKDFNAPELAGKTKTLKVTLTALKTKNVPALDDDLAQDVNEKFKTLEDLKADLKKNLQFTLDKKLEELRNDSLLSQLVEKNPIVLPASMVNAELDSRFRMLARQFQTNEEQLVKLLSSSGQTKEKLQEGWKADVEKALKARLIVETLMKDKNITVSPEEVEAEYKSIAEKANTTVEDIQKHYSDPRMKEYLIDDIKENKLYKDLLENATVKKGKKTTFSELFSSEQ